MEDIYRAILTNDHDSAEERVNDKYIQRGVCEKNFDVQNNDFGWAHLPFSTMEDNTVFMLFAAMLKNSCQYLPDKACRVFHRVDMRSRLKRFVFSFIVVPVEWGGAWQGNGHWTSTRVTGGCTIGPPSTSLLDETDVFEGWSLGILYGGKEELCA